MRRPSLDLKEYNITKDLNTVQEGWSEQLGSEEWERQERVGPRGPQRSDDKRPWSRIGGVTLSGGQ